MMGLAALVFQWPLLIVFHYSGIESFALPDALAVQSLAMNVVFYVACETFIYLGIYFMSPLFVSLGLMVTMPLTVVVDKLLNAYVLPALGIMGVALILAGNIFLHATSYLFPTKPFSKEGEEYNAIAGEGKEEEMVPLEVRSIRTTDLQVESSSDEGKED